MYLSKLIPDLDVLELVCSYRPRWTEVVMVLLCWAVQLRCLCVVAVSLILMSYFA